MQSNYKSLGEYIRLVKVKNFDDSVKELLGINIDKFFMPSVANIVGTDLSKYQIVQKNQFACNRMHVGRDYRIPVAKSDSDSPFIVSPAYDVFEIIDESILLPDYLMLWFKRREFDRNAWFYTDADVRGGLHWRAFIEIKLPIPSPDKQKELIAEYEAVESRIQLNKKLCTTLEETAQTIYKHWFEDFEFPNENGKPYKSSGGEMVECEELGKEIPKGWKLETLNDIIKHFISKRGKSKSVMNLQLFDKEFKFPVVSAMNINGSKIVKYDSIPYINIDDYNEWMNEKLEADDVLLTSEAPLGETYYIANISDFALSQRIYALRTDKKKLSGWFLYLWFKTHIAKQELEGRASGTTVFGIKLSELKKIKILIPNQSVELNFTSKSIQIAERCEIIRTQTQKLEELKSLLLGKLTIEN